MILILNSSHLFPGLIVGAFLRYTGTPQQLQHLDVTPLNTSVYNASLPPDALWLQYHTNNNQNKTYAYIFRGEIVPSKNYEIDLKVSKAIHVI